ncbi:hypothetical protein [Terriglobus roseus]|uniref:Uncharacterized protein n=1 Tax=Terriglobus roseus TaxID=392734 RepID=A0A1H4IWJ0_9BACT|nr:hypothetical protein [Terriglobus roseus]SEB38460.1 hypothetical protein SAMN05443244_0156 [Terriglobus roseus]
MQAPISLRSLLPAWLAAGMVILSPVALFSQAPSYPTMNTTQGVGARSIGGSGTGIGTGVGSMHTPDLAGELDSPTMIYRRDAARKLERKKRMVDSANRLLQLTQQLKTELATREATADDAKRLDEIAKLARLVKDQMRD